MRAPYVLCSAAALLMSSLANGAELNFTSWGGSYQAAQEKTALQPFGERSKVSIKSNTYNGGIAQIRSQVQTNNVSWDVVDMQLADAMRACDEGLLEKINPAQDLVGPTTDDFLPRSLNECLAGNITWSTLIAYNKDKFGSNPPTKVADFFDLKKYPGKRALRKAPEGAMEWALMADGVPVDQVYKVLATNAGVERAFKKLDTIKSSVVWWETGSQAPQLLADGEVAMASAYNGRIYNAIISDKKPFDFIWDGQLLNIEGYVIVKGSKNLKEAKAFVRYATQPEVLAALAPLTANGPVRKSSMPHVSEKVIPYLPTAPKNQKVALSVDPEFWADHLDDLNQKFAAWLTRK
jgi:putative spermidine/putrescine transport system substrate-binding protein